MLSKIREIVLAAQKTSSPNSALDVLLPHVEDGTLSQYDLEDSIIEMFFSAYNGRQWE